MIEHRYSNELLAVSNGSMLIGDFVLEPLLDRHYYRKIQSKKGLE